MTPAVYYPGVPTPTTPRDALFTLTVALFWLAAATCVLVACQYGRK